MQLRLAPINVELDPKRYVCKIDPVQFSKFHGKRILLSSIIDESRNASAFNYYNPDGTITYKLYNSSSSPILQLVIQYFWYGLQKGFDCAGVKIEAPESTAYDAELSLTFNSLTDEEIRFKAILTKAGKLTYRKDYVINIPEVNTTEKAIFEQRAYGMLDSIVTTILNDPDFQKAFL
jgi:hypothetical protein